MSRKPNRYHQIIDRVFFAHYTEGDEQVSFTRDEFVATATELGIDLPKNLGDITYTFRYRATLPDSVRSTATPGKVWVIRSVGRSRYCFAAITPVPITPNPQLAETKIPDATPGVIDLYATGDEQALLAKLRYNRLVDIFTGVTAYSLQNHLRTFVTGVGQVETDEIYIGLDRRGAHYVIPLQAKAAHETLGIVQIEQDFALCQDKFPQLICIPIGAQFISDNTIALFAFERTEAGARISFERHYRLVPPDELSPDDLAAYQTRPE